MFLHTGIIATPICKTATPQEGYNYYFRFSVLQLYNCRGSGASEQLGGGTRRTCKTCPTRGGLGAWSPRKIFQFACSEIESGATWRHLKPSTHIVKLSNPLAMEQYTRSHVCQCVRQCVQRCNFSDNSETNAHADWKDSLC